jgi:hypothetical protein
MGDIVRGTILQPVIEITVRNCHLEQCYNQLLKLGFEIVTDVQPVNLQLFNAISWISCCILE